MMKGFMVFMALGGFLFADLIGSGAQSKAKNSATTLDVGNQRVFVNKQAKITKKAYLYSKGFAYEIRMTNEMALLVGQNSYTAPASAD